MPHLAVLKIAKSNIEDVAIDPLQLVDQTGRQRDKDIPALGRRHTFVRG
jgi:hypothetical protein